MSVGSQTAPCRRRALLSLELSTDFTGLIRGASLRMVRPALRAFYLSGAAATIWLSAKLLPPTDDCIGSWDVEE